MTKKSFNFKFTNINDSSCVKYVDCISSWGKNLNVYLCNEIKPVYDIDTKAEAERALRALKRNERYYGFDIILVEL